MGLFELFLGSLEKIGGNVFLRASSVRLGPRLRSRLDAWVWVGWTLTSPFVPEAVGVIHVRVTIGNGVLGFVDECSSTLVR